MSGTRKDKDDCHIANPVNDIYSSNTNIAENDIPSELGTRENSPVLNLDDWEGEDPFASSHEFESFDEKPTAGTNAHNTLNTSQVNEQFQAIFADSSALELNPRALPSKPHLAPDASQPLVFAYECSRKRGAPEESLSSSSKTGDSRTEGVSGIRDNVSGSSLSRRKKKHKGMPKRPLSAYNLYFKAQRTNILAKRQAIGKDGRGIGFEELGKIVGRLWKELGNAEKRIYEKMAEKDGERYRKEMDAYNEMRNKLYKEEANRPLATARCPLVAAPAMDRPDVGTSTAVTNLMFASSDFRPPTQHSCITSSTSSSEVHPGQFSVSSSSTSERALPATLPYDAAGAAPVLGPAHPSPVQGLRLTASQDAPAHPPVMHSHASHQGQHSMRGPPTTLSPTSFDRGDATDNGGHFPIPPGMEIVLSDINGIDRKYRVHYQCFSMTREAAHQYLERLSGASAVFHRDYTTGSQPMSMSDATTRLLPTAPIPVQNGSQYLLSHHQYNGIPRF